MRRTLLLATALLGGCDLAPRYRTPPPPVSRTLPQGPAYAPEPPTAQPADVAWRDFFTDPRLQGVIALALANNRDLRVALANVVAARAQYRVQRADLFPAIGANAQATYSKSPGGFASGASGVGGTGTGGTTGTGTGTTGTGTTGSGTGGSGTGGTGATGTGVGTGATVTTGASRIDLYQAGFGISAWEIDLFGRVRNLTKTAFEQYLASAAARDGAQVTLIADTANAYLTMASDQERLRIARDNVRAFGETLGLTRARFTGGIASELEVRQAQTSYDQARANVAQAITLVAQDQNALNLLAGTTVPRELLPPGLRDEGSTLPALPAGLSSQVLLRRPDIAEAEHQLRAATANIGAARAAFFPQISLTAAFGTLSLGLGNLFGSGSQFWQVAPTARLPIFDFGKNRGNLRYAEAQRDQLLAQYEKAVQTGFREVADALARRGTIGDELAAQTSQRDAAAKSYQLAEARFRAGIDPFLNTLDSQRALYSAQQTLLATRLTRESNLVELYRALGGGLR